MNACYCSGRCRELGYCPNQGAQARDFLDWAKGKPLPRPHDGRGYTLHTPRGREMAAEDLGLYWDGEWKHLPVKHTDAPYAFWLGAG